MRVRLSVICDDLYVLGAVLVQRFPGQALRLALLVVLPPTAIRCWVFRPFVFRHGPHYTVVGVARLGGMRANRNFAAAAGSYADHGAAVAGVVARARVDDISTCRKSIGHIAKCRSTATGDRSHVTSQKHR